MVLTKETQSKLNIDPAGPKPVFTNPRLASVEMKTPLPFPEFSLAV